jgi:hypothetical protein
VKDALRVVYRSFYESYQSLGFSIWSTLLWWLGALPILTIGSVSAGLFYTIMQKKRGREVTPRDFWHGVIKYFKPSLLITFLYLFVTVPAWIYMTLLLSNEQMGWKTLGFLLLYLLIFWQLVVLYMFPLMIEQEIRRVRVLMKRSFRLVVDHFLFTTVLYFAIILITILSGLIPLLLFTVWISWVARSVYTAMQVLLQRYDGERVSPDLSVHWKGFWKAWKQ